MRKLIIAGLMAAELGLDVAQCRRAAFLHDIGKALTHEVEGSHAMIGADLARKYGENPDIVHAIEAHHNEVEVRTVEAVLTQAADAISGSRPGARRESLEAYVKRLERLEEIASAHQGVEKVFAMQAGRELRVMVVPGSARVRLQAEAEGLDRVFTDFGAEWRNAGCSMCLGMNPDQLLPGERAASTSNRNFEGRQGKGGRTHLVSPLVAAATAVRGTLSSTSDLSDAAAPVPA